MSKPSAKELLGEARDSDWSVTRMLTARVEKVLALHQEYLEPNWRGETTCAYCHDEDGELNRWPCPTRRILEGEGE